MMMTPENELSKLAPGVKEEILISKYDTFINFIKQLNLHLSVGSRNITNHKDVIKSLLNQMDKIVDDYNTYVMMYNASTPIYFFLSSLAFLPKGENKHLKFHKSIIVDNDDFSLHLVFIEQKVKKIHFHTEIWKKTGQATMTNPTLSKLENIFMRELLEQCIQEGFLGYNQTSMCLTNKKQKILFSSTRMAAQSNRYDYVLAFIEREAKDFLVHLTRLFSTMIECSFCSKYLMFDSKNKIFEPPLIKISDSVKQEFKYFHESCCLKYFHSKTR